MLSLTPIVFEGQWKTVTQFADDLAVGSFVHVDSLVKEGWVCIVLTKAAPEPMPPSIKLPLIDGRGNDRQRLQRAIRWVLQQWMEGKRVAVLCRHGASRSPALAAAALYAAGRASSVHSAIEWMRRERREIGPFGAVAREFELAAADMVTLTLRPGICARSHSKEGDTSNE